MENKKYFQAYLVIGLLLNLATLSLSTEDDGDSLEDEDTIDGSEEAVAVDLKESVHSEESFLSSRDFRVRRSLDCNYLMQITAGAQTETGNNERKYFKRIFVGPGSDTLVTHVTTHHMSH